MSYPVLSNYIVAADKLTDRTEVLVLSTRTGKKHLISADLWDALRNGNIADLPQSLRDRLVGQHLLTQSRSQEFREVMKENRRAADRTDGMLYQVIQPSALCQMGCYYCGQEHRAKWIDPRHILKIVDRITHLVEDNDYRRLYLGWFGAEPLTAVGQMRQLGGLLRDLCDQYRMSFGGKIITNGLNLVPRHYDLLVKELQIDFFEVTLDGPAATHDKHRDLKTGGGTFDKIYRNLRSLLDYRDRTGERFVVSIRCNVDENNKHAVSELINLLDADGILPKVKFYATGVYSWGENKNAQKMEKAQFAARELGWIDQLFSLGVDVRGHLVPSRTYTTCLATKRNARVYDADGKVFTCTEIPFTAGDTGSKFYAGTLDQETHPHRDHEFWYDELESGRSAYPCPSCPMLPVCGGGCPKQWEDGEMACPTFKFNAVEKLRRYYNWYAKRPDPVAV